MIKPVNLVFALCFPFVYLIVPPWQFGVRDVVVCAIGYFLTAAAYEVMDRLIARRRRAN